MGELILERMVIVGVLMASIGLIGLGLRQWQARRVASLAVERPFAGLVPEGQPAIVAFTLPGCGECRSRQAPAIERLRQQVGNQVTITTLAADRHETLLGQLGLMTVPATAILDAAGMVRVINQGFADEHRLQQQLAMLNQGAVAR